MHPVDFARRTTLPTAQNRFLAQNIARLTGVIEAAGYGVMVTPSLRQGAQAFLVCTDEPLSVLADPRFHDEARTGTTTICLLLYRGDTVTGCSIQRRLWTRDLVADMRNLSFWFQDPAQAPAGTRCLVNPTWLDQVRGFVVYSCGFAVARDAQRVEGLSIALVRLAHAVALAHWEWDWLIGRGRRAIANRYAFDHYGIDQIGNGCWLLLGGSDPAHIKDHPHAVMGSTREAFLGQALRPAYGNPSTSLCLPAELAADVVPFS